MRWYHLVLFILIVAVLVFVLTWGEKSGDLSYTVVEHAPIRTPTQATELQPTPTVEALLALAPSPTPVPLVASSTAIITAPTDVYEIVGYAQNREGEFLSGAEITIKAALSNRGPVNTYSPVFTDDNGYYHTVIPGPEIYFYQINSLPPGNYVKCVKSLEGKDVQSINVINFVHDIGDLAFWGKVIDKDNKAPIAKAHVDLHPRREHPIQKYPIDGYTQSDGQFYIDRLAEGPFEFTVRAHGYEVFDSNGQGDDYQSGILISPETQNREYLIQMTPGRCILVRVKDQQKRPVSDATVELLMESQDYHILSSVWGKTDAAGECMLDMLPNMKAMVNVKKENYGEVWSEPVRPGRRNNPTIVELVLVGESSISGVVTHLDGTPAPDMTLYMLRMDLYELTKDGLPLTPTKTDENGRYVFRGLGVGTYKISLSNEEQRQYYEEKEIDLKENEHKTSVDFVIDESELTEEIRGRVVNSLDEPIADARVSVQMLQRNNPNLITGLQGLGNSASTRTDEDGRFAIDKLRKADEYSVRVIAEGYDVFLEMYPMDKNDLTIVLPSTASLSGRVVNRTTKSPIAGAKVEARPTGFSGMTLSGECDSDGAFRFEDIKPGAYQLFAFAKGYANAEETEIVLNSNDDKSVDIFMQSASELRGVVLSPDRAPLQGARLFLHSEVIWKAHPVIWNEEISAAQIYSTKSDGTFLIPSISKQGDILYCYHPDYALRIYEIPPDWNSDEPLTLYIDRGGSIEGKVSYADGSAGANKSILCTDNIDRPFLGMATMSGEDGTFRFDNLPTLSLTVAAVENESKKESIVKKQVVVQGGETVNVDIVFDSQ